MYSVCAETCGVMTLAATTHGGVQVSTTQTIKGAMVDVAAQSRTSSAHRGVTKAMVIASTAIVRAASILVALFYSLRFWMT